MTSTEFIQWAEFLDREEDVKTKENYYLAQIATEVRRSYVKHPARVKLKHMLLEFKRRLRKKSTQSTSKQFWFGGLGIKEE